MMRPSPGPRMELRMKQSRELSPDRAKLWIDPKTKQPRKVQVLYYLSRNGLLEHPHFMEVTLSSNEGLYLRDVINRLNILRGKGMPYLFSWSSKRSYKNGYVWHDLSENDIIYPAQGNEYVLKGSELYEGSSDRYHHGTNGKTQNPKHSLEGHHSIRHQDGAISTDRSLVVHKRRTNIVQESALETDRDSRGQICTSHVLPSKLQDTLNISTSRKDLIEDHNQLTVSSSAPALSCGSTSERGRGGPRKSHVGDLSWNPLEVGEYKVYKAESIASTIDQGADAATQTYERRRIRCTRGVSTEEGESEHVVGNFAGPKQNQEDQNPTELSGGEVSPPPSSSTSPGSPNARLKSNTRVNILRHSHEEESFITTRSRAATVLMQLISCGSIAVKDHNFVIIPHSKSRISYEESRSRTRGISSGFVRKATIEEELECMPENPRLASLQLEDKEYFSGSLVETKIDKEVGGEVPSLKRCASYNADRSSKSDLLERSNSTEGGGTRSKCIPRKIKSLKKQPRKNAPKNSPKLLKGGHTSDSKRLSNGISTSTQTTNHDVHASLNVAAEIPQRLDSFKEEQNVFKKDERQTSATGIAIESQATIEDGKEGTLQSSQQGSSCKSKGLLG